MSLLKGARRWLMRRVISIALKNPAPSGWFTTSGEEGESNNLYIVYLNDEAAKSRFVVNSMTTSGLEGKWSSDAKNFEEPRSIPNSDLTDFTLYVLHFYRGWEFKIYGVWPFLWRWAVNYYYFRVAADRRKQAKFNKLELTRHERMQVLTYIKDRTMKDRQYIARVTDLLTQFYSIRWVHRPDQDELKTYYTFLLDALKDSGDLESIEYGYRLKARALNSITAFAQEERRHSENQNVQRGIFWLTVVLMIVGIVQGVSATWEAFFKAAPSL